MISNDEAILSIDTLMHYGLKQQPFAAEAPDAYIYSDPALDMPVNAALNFLQTEDHIVLLKGEYGIGKTTHVKKLINKARGTLTPCLFSANISSSLAEIEHSMRQCWPHEQAQLDLETFLTAIQTKGMRPTLIIDDAHDLDVDVLEQLLLIRREVKERSGRGFGLLLVGESNIEHTLSSLEADIPEIGHAHSLVLRPLTREQVHAYIDHRMRIAGMFMPSPYDAESIEEIVRETYGLPGDINNAATRFLEKYGQAVLNREKANRPGWLHHNRVPLIIIIVASIALIGIIVLIQGLFLSEDPKRDVSKRVISAPIPAAGVEKDQPSLSETEATSPKPDIEDTKLVDPVARLVTTTEEPEAPPAATIEPEPILPTETTPAPVSEAPKAETTPEPAEDKTAPATSPASQAEVKEPAPETPIAPPAIEKTTFPEVSPTLKNPEWILKQDPAQFSVQLLALSSLEALNKATNDLQIDADLAYYTRKKDGKTLYILIAATYPDRAAAEKAVNAYPASLRRGKPWIRPLKDIQDTIYAQ
ncbi:MAG: AAA family ATPase [Gammaproteobacteria bacterium]|nr:AAA family ATPase [Gammaproteobacteria bacterium]